MSYLEKSAPEVDAELKKLGGEVQNALTALREATETKNTETLKRVETFFAKYEDANSKFAKEYALHQKALADAAERMAAAETKAAEVGKTATDAEKRIKDLELKIATTGSRDNKAADPRDTPEYKSCINYLTKGDKPTGGIWAWRPEVPMEIKTLRTDSDVQGGYLIPQVMDSTIRKNITEMSPVRLFARVRVAPSKTMDIPRRLSIPTALYEGETEAAPTDQSTYGSEQVTLYRQTIKVPATLDMMISSAFDLEAEIAADVGESFAKGEGTNFISGLGVKSPQGIIKDTRAEVVTTASSGVMDWTDLTTIMGKLKRGQAPWWFMNRRTLASLQSVKSTIGVPIWQPVAGNLPATIWGFPYNSDMIDLDDAQNGSNAKPLLFADLRRGYEIFDMIGISVIRDDLTKADQAITQWIFRRYNTGRVIMPEAIKILKIL